MEGASYSVTLVKGCLLKLILVDCYGKLYVKTVKVQIKHLVAGGIWHVQPLQHILSNEWSLSCL